MTKNEAYVYAAAVLLIHISNCIFVQNYTLWVQQLGIEMKVSFSSFLYRKSLKLTPSEASNIVGKYCHLDNRDVNKFIDCIQMVNNLLIGAVQSAVICYLIYNKMGVSAFIGIGIVISALPVQVYVAKYITKLRLKIGKQCDERLQMLQETYRLSKLSKCTHGKNISEMVSTASGGKSWV
ncbi:hypothetical protein JTB14_030571 [Gonioctena quinquepunctata]|nr:hypothetical protein JTB14_030571 [Gonioctena quinquepunctata]